MLQMVEFLRRSSVWDVPQTEQIVNGFNFLLHSAMVDTETSYTLVPFDTGDLFEIVVIGFR